MRIFGEILGIFISLMVCVAAAEGMEKNEERDPSSRGSGRGVKGQTLGRPMRILPPDQPNGEEYSDKNGATFAERPLQAMRSALPRPAETTDQVTPAPPRPTVHFDSPTGDEATGLMTQRPSRRCRCTCSTKCKVAGGLLGCCGALITSVLSAMACQECCCHS